MLNNALPGGASWACLGCCYTPPARSITGGLFTSTVGLDASGTNGVTVPVRLMVTSVDWYPGCDDPFDLGPQDGSGEPGTLYLAASWISRAQARGLLIAATQAPNPAAPAVLQPVTLTPASGELQPATAAVGWANSARPQGDYRTGGSGLDGYTSGSASEGLVAAVGENATQTFQSRRLSRVALRGPVTPDCCAQLLFHTPLLTDPIPALAGDEDALPVEEWRRE